MSRSHRTAIVIPRLSGGGAERAALELASAFPDRYQVIAEADGGELSGDPVAQRAWQVGEGSRSRIGRVRRLARTLAVGEFDLCLSTLSPLVAAAAGRLAGIPTGHWLQNPVFTIPGATVRGARGTISRFMLATHARSAAFLAAPAPGLLAEWQAYGAEAQRMALLPNPLRVSEIQVGGGNHHDRHHIVTVGRLSQQKRHDLLISAIAQLDDIPVDLTIVGCGPLKQELCQLADSLHLADRVRFAGFHRQPWSLLPNADVFALGSDYEGFGNVLVEALAAGLPVVATDAPYGPRFILDDGRLGHLVPPGSALALAEGIRQAIQSPVSERDTRRRRAQCFAPTNVAARLDAIADCVLGNRPFDREMCQWP